MNLKQFARLVGLTAVVMVLVLTHQAATVEAQGTTTVAVSPAVTLVNVGNVATVNVVVTDYTNLYGADVTVTYDQTKVQVQDDNPFMGGVNVTVGPLLGTTTDFPGQNYFNLTNFADNSLGQIRFVITQLNPTVPRSCTAPCSGTLFTIHFLATTTGVSPVNITFQKLSDPNANQIAATPVNGFINILAPTASIVTAFRGGVDRGQARLTWETGSEISLLGFNVWASENATTGFVKRNAALIAAKTPGELKGNGYEFQEAASRSTYYKLEIVQADNSSEWMGPIEVGDAAACATKPLAAALLAPANDAAVAADVTLDWTDAVCAKGYRVQIRRDGVKGSVAQNRRVTPSTLDTTLERGHSYYWRVRTLGDKGRSAWSEGRAFIIR